MPANIYKFISVGYLLGLIQIKIYAAKMPVRLITIAIS